MTSVGTIAVPTKRLEKLIKLGCLRTSQEGVNLKHVNLPPAYDVKHVPSLLDVGPKWLHRQVIEGVSGFVREIHHGYGQLRHREGCSIGA